MHFVGGFGGADEDGGHGGARFELGSELSSLAGLYLVRVWSVLFDVSIAYRKQKPFTRALTDAEAPLLVFLTEVRAISKAPKTSRKPK